MCGDPNPTRSKKCRCFITNIELEMTKVRRSFHIYTVKKELKLDRPLFRLTSQKENSAIFSSFELKKNLKRAFEKYGPSVYES